MKDWSALDPTSRDRRVRDVAQVFQQVTNTFAPGDSEELLSDVIRKLNREKTSPQEQVQKYNKG